MINGDRWDGKYKGDCFTDEPVFKFKSQSYAIWGYLEYDVIINFQTCPRSRPVRSMYWLLKCYCINSGKYFFVLSEKLCSRNMNALCETYPIPLAYRSCRLFWVHALALFQIGKHSGGQAETIRTSGITLLGHINRCIYHILQGCVTCTRTIPLIVREITLKYNNMVNQFHKSHNAPDSHPTTHHSEQKHAHFCSEWWIAGFGTSDL